MLAHIAGIPAEETALSFAPVALALGAIAAAWLGRLVGRPGERKALAMREESAPRAKALARRPA
jgi:hypothetical protein